MGNEQSKTASQPSKPEIAETSFAPGSRVIPPIELPTPYLGDNHSPIVNNQKGAPNPFFEDLSGNYSALSDEISEGRSVVDFGKILGDADIHRIIVNGEIDKDSKRIEPAVWIPKKLKKPELLGIEVPIDSEQKIDAGVHLNHVNLGLGTRHILPDPDNAEYNPRCELQANLEIVIKKFPNGDLYEGECRGGIPSGKGILKYANGNVYTGGFINGKYNGEGELRRVNGDVIKGAWIAGVKEGRFEESLNQGEDEYYGYYENGERTGHGGLKVRGEFVYIGEFKRNLLHGRGKLTFLQRDNMSYAGQFKEGKMTGRGIITWPDGEFGDSVYDGEVLDGKRHGFGVFTDQIKNKYVGDWADDMRQGEGVCVSENGAVYQVTYEKDKLLSKVLDPKSMGFH